MSFLCPLITRTELIKRINFYPAPPVAVDVLVGEEEVEVLGHVPHLLGHCVAVHHKHQGAGGAAKLVHNLRV